MSHDGGGDKCHVTWWEVGISVMSHGGISVMSHGGDKCHVT